MGTHAQEEYKIRYFKKVLRSLENILYTPAYLKSESRPLDILISQPSTTYWIFVLIGHQLTIKFNVLSLMIAMITHYNFLHLLIFPFSLFLSNFLSFFLSLLLSVLYTFIYKKIDKMDGFGDSWSESPLCNYAYGESTHEISPWVQSMTHGLTRVPIWHVLNFFNSSYQKIY